MLSPLRLARDYRVTSEALRLLDNENSVPEMTTVSLKVIH